MSRWIDNRLADRLFMVNRVSETKNIDPESVEKDWWVIMVLTGSWSAAFPWSGRLEKNMPLVSWAI